MEERAREAADCLAKDHDVLVARGHLVMDRIAAHRPWPAPCNEPIRTHAFGRCRTASSRS
ncbi:hypothetical protein ACFXPW_07330 [Streptomyces goshikiensis]|uniref:hypothetical protein n=1 Tax=Streptomyces goshikiensis TaxID=1942 RepID=UPI0036BABDDD